MPATLEFGFRRLRDRKDALVTAVGVTAITQAADNSIAEHNRQFVPFMNLFVEPTTEVIKKYTTRVRTRNQALDEHGRALPIKGKGGYTIGLPLWHSGNAWGQNYLEAELSTVQATSDLVGDLIFGDQTWVFDQVLSALFEPDSYDWEEEDQPLVSVKPLANGDGIEYLVRAGYDTPATDNHLLAQAGAVSDAANPYPTMADDLREHPENAGGTLIAFIPSNLKAATQGLANFLDPKDANVRDGDGVTTLNNGLPSTLRYPGELLGYERTAKMWIIEWPRLPDNYIVAIAAGADPPLAMREYAPASLRGFRRVAVRQDYPYFESQYLRSAGFGANNRVGAVVMRIGNASYAPPTRYTSLRGR